MVFFANECTIFLKWLEKKKPSNSTILRKFGAGSWDTRSPFTTAGVPTKISPAAKSWTAGGRG
jgi:hypothetical protein